MTSLLRITQDRVLMAYNIALARRRDQTGEIKDPSFGFSVGVGVGQVFKTSGKNRSQATKDHHINAKDAVWEYHRSIQSVRKISTRCTQKCSAGNSRDEFDPEEWAKHPITDHDLDWAPDTRFIDAANYVSP